MDYQTIFDHLPVGIFQCTPEGKFILANHRLAELFGYDSPAHLCASITNIGTEIYLDPRQFQEFIHLATHHQLVRDFQALAKRKDGSPMWLAQHGRPIFDDHKNLRYLEGSMEDITARHHLEQAILQRNDELDALNRIARLTSTARDPDSMLQTVAQELLNRFHAKQCTIALLTNDGTHLSILANKNSETPDNEEFSPHTILLADDPLAQQTLTTKKTTLQTNPTDPTTSCLVLPLLAQRTTLGLIEIQFHSSNSPTPETCHLAETMGDHISRALANLNLLEQSQALLAERRLTEAKLRASGEALRTIFNGVYVAIFILYLDGKIMDINQRMLDMFQVSQTEALALDFGHTILNLPHPTTLQTLTQWQLATNGQPQLFEWPIHRQKDNHTFEAELFLQRVLIEGESFILANVRDISERKAAEKAVQLAYRRTQTLYNISNTLTTSGERAPTVQTIISHYLQLLGWDWGALFLFERQELYQQQFWLKNSPTTTTIAPDPTTWQTHLATTPHPLYIPDTTTHPLTQTQPNFCQSISTACFFPIWQAHQLGGLVVIGSSTPPPAPLSPAEISLGEALADQLGLWLERRLLLKEAQYRSERLQTAAEVSRVANSILQIETLIDTSVNLIRDQFNFYYVGLFLLDEANEWAVLKAGTGEPGQRMLARHHRLKIGSGMIGWSVANRQARIALDVGHDAVRFANPDLPDTHSEMALPLISRDEVLGALTVQSTARAAFSNEDITLLQTMADQLANAIKNARLFEWVAQAQQEAEARLQETMALQEFSQALASTLDWQEIITILCQTITHQVGLAYCHIWLIEEDRPWLKLAASMPPSPSENQRTKIRLEPLADLFTQGQPKFSPPKTMLLPMHLRLKPLGLVEVGYGLPSHISETAELLTTAPSLETPTETLLTQTKPENPISPSQIRQLQALVSQTALGLDNAYRYEASQRAARLEAIIKEITTKVRASTDLDTIIQTAVREVGRAVQPHRAYIQIN